MLKVSLIFYSSLVCVRCGHEVSFEVSKNLNGPMLNKHIHKYMQHEHVNVFYMLDMCVDASTLRI